MIAIFIKSRSFLTLFFSFIVIFMFAGGVQGATIYVGPTGDYPSISEAVTAASQGDRIIVAPGTYDVLDGITIDKELNISSESGPELTRIISSGSNAIYITTVGSNSSISGFYIRGLSYGVEMYGNSGSVILRGIRLKNNIIEGSGMYGIYMHAAGGNAHVQYNTIENNVISGNGNHGIYLLGNSSGSDSHIQFNNFNNNIIMNNGGYGISDGALSSNHVYLSNNLFNNISGSSSGVTLSPDNGNLFINPLVVDSDTGNYKLLSASPGIDAGRTGQSFVDPDGTRNDIGAFGGPGSASFWPSPAGGPVVTDLQVSPPSVAAGGTITIRATGEVR